MCIPLVFAILVSGTASIFSTDGSSGGWMQPEATIETGNSLYITVVNTWQAPYAQHILDLEYIDEYPGSLAFISSLDNRIFLADPDDGTLLGSIDRPAGMYGFGLAWFDGEYYINSWSSSSIYHSDGSGTWTTFANPAGSNGRGMECYPAGFDFELWESGSSGSSHPVFCMDSLGTVLESFDLTDIPGQISGLTVYPLTTPGNSSTAGFIVSCYNYPSFYSYVDGYAEGPTPHPFTVGVSYGLASAYMSRGTFFWSYQGTDGVHYVSELSIDVNSLESSTWGEIKSVFD